MTSSTPHPKSLNVLVIKFRHIGDVLLTAPLISTLHRAAQVRRVCAVVKPGTEEMLIGLQDLDKLYVLPRREPLEPRLLYLKRYLLWLLELRRERFDIAINSTEGDRGILLSWLIGAKMSWSQLKTSNEKWWRKLLVTRTFPPLTGRQHIIMRNLALARPLTNHLCREVKYVVSQQSLTKVQNLLTEQGWDGHKHLVHIHPVSRWLFKCWKSASFATVIDWLQNDGLQVVLSSADDKNELEMVRNILRHTETRPLDLSGKLRLNELAALSSISRVFLGVDSAPMHIAAAVNTPVIALFGPTGTFDWGPWPNGWLGENTPYPNQNGVQSANSHTVIQAKLDCAPCGRAGCDDSKNSECLALISPDEVIAAVRASLLSAHDFQQ